MTPSFELSLVLVIELSFRVWYNEVTQYYNHVMENVKRRSRQACDHRESGRN